MKKRRLMKSHLKMCGRKTCKFDDNSYVRIRQRSSSVHSLEIPGHYLLILQLILMSNRGVSTRESDDKIKETLEDYGYQIQEVKRFHKMPIVKLLELNMISLVMFIKMILQKKNQILKNGGNAMIESLVFLFRIRQTLWWLNKKQLLHQTQAGFRSWHNTDELLLRLTHSIAI
ncbi:hypothetical protein RFI_26773 [Reticulomyxa filosa]|uniref:Uncharacterized protein n=1 Tax=Reticulomyxa filosa TaxID=46433 RepID=X6M9C4_RETFI|nr:hypothetical protein RFI_26773 [Reticulomyxa filosa]|eukprot:ETO10603.1 hypothetical protein RFI_26773 [Reticulomyxa filosa]